MFYYFKYFSTFYHEICIKMPYFLHIPVNCMVSFLLKHAIFGAVFIVKP
jgi:hypothetical protein